MIKFCGYIRCCLHQHVRLSISVSEDSRSKDQMLVMCRGELTAVIARLMSKCL